MIGSSLARATAESIRTVGHAIAGQGGADAVNLRLSTQYIQKLGALSMGARVLLPADLTNVDALVGGVRIDDERSEPRALPERSPLAVPVPALTADREPVR